MTNDRLKSQVVSIPIVGYVLRVISNIAHLPRLKEQIINLNDKLTAVYEGQEKKITKFNAAIFEEAKARKASHKELQKKISGVSQAHDNLSNQFNILESIQQAPNHLSKEGTSEQKKDLFADDHILDAFYINFEDHFRGSEEMITERLKEYLPYFENSKIDFKNTPVLDLGSGRGEFLQLLKKHKIRAIGLDINLNMVERANKKGLKAVQGDALEHLKKTKAQSYGAITGFHIVEHIPFNILLRIFTNAYRSLVQDGFVLFETPNPENIIVGSAAFYTDPSHLNPLPPDLLAFAIETCGFKDVEIKRLHPVEGKDAAGLPEEVAGRFYGPRDYAVIGYK